jgi:hypothetical protein
MYFINVKSTVGLECVVNVAHIVGFRPTDIKLDGKDCGNAVISTTDGNVLWCEDHYGSIMAQINRVTGKVKGLSDV